MNKQYVLLLSGLLSVSLSAQKSIISEGAESINIAELRDHMFYLASDELEGRQSGTAGYDKAAQYVSLSGDNADIHMLSDDAGKIDFDFFQKSCRLVYEIIMELANGETGLKE